MVDNPADDLKNIEAQKENVAGSSPVVYRLKEYWEQYAQYYALGNLHKANKFLSIIENELSFKGKMTMFKDKQEKQYMRFVQSDDHIALHFKRELGKIFHELNYYNANAGETGETDEEGDPIRISYRREANVALTQADKLIQEKAKWLRSKADAYGLYTKNITEGVDFEPYKEER